MILCPHCNNEVPENSRYCNYCGAEITQQEVFTKSTTDLPTNNKKGLIITACISLLLLSLVGWAFFFGPYSGPPNQMIAVDHQHLIDEPNQSVQIINKSRCTNLPAEVKALGVSDVWVVGIKGSGPYAITTVYAKQNGEWRDIFASECP